MKKVLSIILASVICIGSCFSLTGCSGEKQVEKYKIGICQLMEHLEL